jgi:hypothetical protein
MLTNKNALKKLGRRKSGCWGRPSRKYNKRQASKGVRRMTTTLALASVRYGEEK